MSDDKKSKIEIYPLEFFGAWLLAVVLLYSDRYIKALNVLHNQGLQSSYLVASSLLSFFRYFLPIPYLLGLRRRRTWMLIFFLCAAALLLMVGQVSPYMDAGGDRDQALRLGLAQLGQGQSPYLAKTSLGNPVSPLPGAFLLALPSYLLFGRGDVLNVFFILLLGFLVYRRVGDKPWALSLIVGLFLAHPTALNAFYGGDLLWPIVLLAASIELAAAKKPIPAGLVLGLALNCRMATLVFLAIPLIAYTAFKLELYWSKILAVAVLTIAALDVPVFLLDPPAMLNATLMKTGFGKLLHPDATNLFLWLLTGLRNLTGAIYPVVIFLLIGAMQTLVVWRNRIIPGMLTAQMLGLALVTFTVTHDHTPPEYLAWAITLGAYLLATWAKPPESAA